MRLGEHRWKAVLQVRLFIGSTLCPKHDAGNRPLLAADIHTEPVASAARREKTIQRLHGYLRDALAAFENVSVATARRIECDDNKECTASATMPALTWRSTSPVKGCTSRRSISTWNRQ
jgi:hypothetical protein